MRRILKTYADPNRTKAEIRDLLGSYSVDLFSDFGDACRTELAQLQMRAWPTALRCSGWGRWRTYPLLPVSSDRVSCSSADHPVQQFLLPADECLLRGLPTPPIKPSG